MNRGDAGVEFDAVNDHDEYVNRSLTNCHIAGEHNDSNDSITMNKSQSNHQEDDDDFSNADGDERVYH